MNTDSFHDTIVRAARKLPEEDRVPLHFEKRIMARLAGVAPVDVLALWARGLWRAALPCLLLTCLTILWSVGGSTQTAQGEDSLAADLELTMMQPFEDLTSEFLE